MQHEQQPLTKTLCVLITIRASTSLSVVLHYYSSVMNHHPSSLNWGLAVNNREAFLLSAAFFNDWISFSVMAYSKMMSQLQATINHQFVNYHFSITTNNCRCSSNHTSCCMGKCSRSRWRPLAGCPGSRSAAWATGCRPWSWAYTCSSLTYC